MLGFSAPLFCPPQAKFVKTPPLFCPPQAKFLKIWHLKHENSTKIAFDRIGMAGPI